MLKRLPHSKYKNWLINLLILILTTVLLLVLGESLLRWWDGYQLSTLRLNQNNEAVQPTEQDLNPTEAK